MNDRQYDLENFKGINEFIKYLEIIVKRRLVVLIFILGISLTTLIYLLLAEPIFISTITILPEDIGTKSPLGAITKTVNQFSGLNLGGKKDISQLFESIILSRRILKKVLSISFEQKTSKVEKLLVDIFMIEGKNFKERLEIGYHVLFDKIIVTVDKQSGITTLEVESNEAKLSADIAQTITKILDKYLREINTKKASENKNFIDERLQETLGLLMLAEDDLKIFRETNKRIENSPQLQLEQGRLVREVRVQEEVFLTLKKQLEIVKIEEVKSSPLIRILDDAVVPLFKIRPMRKKIMFASIILSVILGMGFTLILEYFSNFYSKTEYKSKLQKIGGILREDFYSFKNYLNIDKSNNEN